MKRVGIFVPIYNNTETLERVLTRLLHVTPHEPTIVVVDDGSTDGSSEIAQRLATHVIRFPENRGVGVATKAGLEYLTSVDRFDFVIKIDGDGQHSPDLVPQVIAELEAGADAVICSRFHPDSKQIATPFDRLLLNRVFAGIISEITGWTLTDTRSGFMGFSGSHIRRIASSIIVERYGIPMELLLHLWNMKPSALIAEVPHPARYGGALPVQHRERYEPGGESWDEKAQRFADAYAAILQVINDLEISPDVLQRSPFLSHLSN